MRVLVLADFSTIHAVRWFEALKERGIEVYGFTLEEPKYPLQGVYKIESPVESKRYRYALSLPKLKRVLKDVKPDILNPHFVSNYGFMVWLLRSELPKVLVLWGSDILSVAKKTPLHFFISKRVVLSSDFIVHDGYVLLKEIEKMGFSPKKTLFITFGVEKELIEKPLKELNGPPYLIVSHRRLEENMGPFTILKALYLLKREGVPFKFKFLSQGSLKERLMKLRDELGLTEHVEFAHRFIPDEELWDILSSSHMYISASLWDSTSVSLLEAMALGALPVVSDIEANREWVVDSLNGFIFGRGDPEDLKNTIMRALRMREKWDSIRKLNKELIRERANFETHMDRVVELFRSFV